MYCMNLLTEIYERLESITKEMEAHSDILEKQIPMHDNYKASIQELYFDMSSKLKSIGEDERRMFLAVPIIEDFLEKTQPYYKVTINEVLDGTAERKAKNLADFRHFLNESEVNKRWKILEKDIRANIQLLNLPDNETETEHLVYVFDAIMNALTFLDKNSHNLIKIAEGESGNGPCKAIPYVSKHQTISEFADMLKRTDIDCFMTFGAIFPTFGDAEDWLEAYLCNRDSDIRILNFSRNVKKSKEEIRSMVDTYNCQIAVGIKNGNNIWILPVAVGKNNYCNTLKDYSDFFDYGKRRTYLPIQVYFDEQPPAPDGTTELVIREPGWWMRDFIDSHQSVWTVTLFSEIKRLFFDNERKPEPLTVFGDRVKVNVSGMLPGPAQPVTTKFPAIYNQEMTVRLENMLRTEQDKKLVGYLGITEEDFKGTPLFTYNYGTAEKVQDILDKTAMAILGKVAGDKMIQKMVAFLDEYADDCRKRIKGRECEILSMLKEKDERITGCSIIHEHNKPLLCMDGSPVIKYGKPVLATVGKNNSSAELHRMAVHLYYPLTLKDKRPPVYLSIRPRNGKEVVAILGLKEEESPDILDYYSCFLQRDGDEPGNGDILKSSAFQKTIERCMTPHIKEKLEVFDIYMCFNKKEFKELVGFPEPICNIKDERNAG